MNLGMRVNETVRKRKIWENLQSEINSLVKVVKTTDKEAKVYLFGSALTGRHNMASDIDILVVTDVPYGEMLFSLTEKGFEHPFEIHV